MKYWWTIYLLNSALSSAVKRGTGNIHQDLESSDDSASVYSQRSDPFDLEDRGKTADYFNFDPSPLNGEASHFRPPPNTPQKSPTSRDTNSRSNSLSHSRLYSQSSPPQLKLDEHRLGPQTYNYFHSSQSPQSPPPVQALQALQALQTLQHHRNPLPIQHQNPPIQHERSQSKDTMLSRSNSQTRPLLNRRKITNANLRTPPAHYYTASANTITCPLCHVEFGKVEILQTHLDVHIVR